MTTRPRQRLRRYDCPLQAASERRYHRSRTSKAGGHIKQQTKWLCFAEAEGKVARRANRQALALPASQLGLTTSLGRHLTARLDQCRT